MKILVVDDHVLIREALRAVLAQVAADPCVVEASGGAEALRIVAQHADIDLVLLDLSLPDRDGFAVLSELREKHPAVSVVVLSAFHNRANVARALALGALGFIPKTTRRDVMLGALQLIFSGGTYVPPEILGEERKAAVSSDDLRRALPCDIKLTARQREVLALMMQGRSNKAIARLLHLSEPTVKNHVTAILKALNVSNRTEAVIAAGRIASEARSVTTS